MRSRAQTLFHRDYPFAETYEKLSLALEAERAFHNPCLLRVRDLRSLGGVRYRLDVNNDDLLKASPQEGWTFQAGEGINGSLTRVELQHSYITVRCDRDLAQLGLRQIWLRPHDFLSRLRNWVNGQSGPIPLLPSPAGGSSPVQKQFPLRVKQRQAIEKVGPGQSYIWGPPGTGKTYTVGRLVVALRDQGYRVLLLAPTNVAVDLAILSVDDAFEGQLRPGELLRAGQPQLEQLEARSHLLAWQQKQADLQTQLTRLRQRRSRLKRTLSQETRPSQQRVLDPELEACEQELQEAERKRYSQLWKLVSQADILGCTVHASFSRREVADFCEGAKLAVVYDEAGMVARYALAPMLALVRGEDAPCGRLERVPDQVAFAFAGDPKQLSPIANPPAHDVNARGWLSESLMEHLPDDTVMLDEQSRMDEQICRVVSECYYGGQLRTVPDERRLMPPLADGWPGDGVFLIDPKRSIHLPLDARERPGELGKTDTFNEISVRIGALLIRWGLDAGRLRNVLWLTPFRQQTQRLLQATRLLFDSLEADSVVRAGTVHSAQGGEADLVVFDPVKPNHPWLRDPALADRLLNVAISRGRTQVIVLASRNQLRKSCFWKALEQCQEYRIEGTPESPRIR